MWTAPVVVSTIKLRRAGVQDCIDTEDMLIDQLQQYQDEEIYRAMYCQNSRTPQAEELW
jgi:hypothetical protein